MPKKTKADKVPQQMLSLFEKITSRTDEVCRKNLNEEYAQLTRKVTAALCRQDPSPLIGGHIDALACGILYALGFVNFLFDYENAPYMSATDLCEAFGVSQSTGSAKSDIIRDALNMMPLDQIWSLPSLMNNHPNHPVA